jgi:hypothetical protein
MSQRSRIWALWALFVAVAVLVPAGLMSLTSLETVTSTVVAVGAG